MPALPTQDVSTGPGETFFLLMMKNLLQAELAPVHTSIGTMQSQLGHLEPMNSQLQDVANGLLHLQNRVDYMENDADEEALFGSSLEERSGTEAGAVTQNGTNAPTVSGPARRANPTRSTRREEPYAR